MFELRKLTLSDADTFALHANNFNVAKNLTNQFPFPYSRDNALDFIKMTMEAHVTNVLCISIDGDAVGAIGIHPQKDVWAKNAELGYWLAEPYWGKGIMTGGITQMVDYGFRHFDVTRIFARPFGSNIGSRRVLEKAGFNLEARLQGTILKNDVVDDELIYGIRIS